MKIKIIIYLKNIYKKNDIYLFIFIYKIVYIMSNYSNLLRSSSSCRNIHYLDCLELLYSEKLRFLIIDDNTLNSIELKQGLQDEMHYLYIFYLKYKKLEDEIKYLSNFSKKSKFKKNLLKKNKKDFDFIKKKCIYHIKNMINIKTEINQKIQEDVTRRNIANNHFIQEENRRNCERKNRPNRKLEERRLKLAKKNKI